MSIWAFSRQPQPGPNQSWDGLRTQTSTSPAPAGKTGNTPQLPATEPTAHYSCPPPPHLGCGPWEQGPGLLVSHPLPTVKHSTFP